MRKRAGGLKKSCLDEIRSSPSGRSTELVRSSHGGKADPDNPVLKKTKI